MAYASADRAYYDADSHIMELPNFLKAYADPALRDDIPEVSYSASVVTDEEVRVIMDQGQTPNAKRRRRTTPRKAAVPVVQQSYDVLLENVRQSFVFYTLFVSI